VLGQASALELPTVAANLVAQATPETREAKAVEVVRAVNALACPSALPFVVGAITELAPSVAPTVVAEANQLQPAASLATVSAAALVAPAQTSEIVMRAVQQQPATYAQIALVAAQSAPTRGSEILSGVSAALPQVQAFVSRAVGLSSQPDVVTVISQVNQMVAGAAQAEAVAARLQSAAPGAAVTPAQSVYQPLLAGTQKGPPTVTPLTPPFVPTPEVGTGTSVPQSGNDRDYSAP